MKATMDERRVRGQRRLAIMAGLALAAVPARVHAQAPAAEEAQKADEFFIEGKSLYSAGKKQEAYEAYLEAWKRKQSYDIAANLAGVEQLLGKNRDAAEHYAYSLRNYPASEQSWKREIIKKKIAELRKEIGALSIEVNVEGAEVSVDGTRVGSSPLFDDVFVEPGPYTVSAQRDGYAEATQSGLAGKGGDTVKIKLTLVERKKARGSDGHAAGGQTSGAVGSDGKMPVSGFRPGPAWFISGGTLAVVGLGAAVGLNLAANGALTRAQNLKKDKPDYFCSPKLMTPDPVCTELHNTLVNASQLSNAALASYIVGGTFALGTVGLGIWALTRPKAPTITVAPNVGKYEAGLLITGIW